MRDAFGNVVGGKDYTYMQSTVDEICRSLREEPFDWIFETHTFRKKGSRIEFWLGLGDYITEIRGSHNDEVFSGTQGEQIHQAYVEAREIVANAAQKRVINEFLNNPDGDNKTSKRKPWWKFW